MMDAFIPLVIGVTATLGFVALGLGVFVLGKLPPSGCAAAPCEPPARLSMHDASMQGCTQ
jgi:hypothetical protein